MGQQHGSLERPDAKPFHVPGIGQNFAGRPLLDDTPLVHQQDPVRAQDVFGLVLHQDDALDLVPQDLGELEDVALADGVQVGRRFVHDDHRGTARKHRGDGQPLLLASRQAGGVPLFEARQSDPIQRPVDAGFHLIAVHGEVLEGESRLEFHVGGEQLRLEVLEDQADDSCQFVDLWPFGFPLAGYLQASVEPALGKGGYQPVQAAAQGGLPRAGLTDDHGELASAMTIVDLIERGLRGVAVGESEVAELEDRLVQET